MQIQMNLIVFLIISNIVCHKIGYDFCDKNYIDSIETLSSDKYKMTRIHNKTHFKEWLFKYNFQTNKTTISALIFKTDCMIQSGYHIPIIPKCNPSTNDCEQMQKLQNKTFEFYYELEYQEYRILGSDFPYGLQRSDSIRDNKFWPKGWKTRGQIYKPSTYWPNRYYFLYIINGKTSSEKATLITNTLLNKNWTHYWNYNSINGSEGKQYTAAFWWTNTQTIHVVIENRTHHRKDCVYEFDPNDLNNPFKPTWKSVIEFFGCEVSENMTDCHKYVIKRVDKEYKSSYIWLYVIGFSLLFVLIISIFVTIYFCYYKESIKQNAEFVSQSNNTSLDNIEGDENMKVRSKTTAKRKQKKKTKSKKLIQESSRDLEIKEPTLQSIGFKPKEQPIGSLKDPIPIEYKD